MSVKELERFMKQNPYAMIAHIVRNDITCVLYLMKKKESEKAIQRLNRTLQSLQELLDKAICRKGTNDINIRTSI